MVPNHICKTLSSCYLRTASSIHWSVASHAGWPGRLDQRDGVVELEEPGRLGQQGRAVELHASWPGRVDQQGRNFNGRTWFWHVFHTYHNSKEYYLFVLTLLSILFSYCRSSIPFCLQNGCRSHPPSHRKEGMGVGDSLETLRTQCWYPQASPCESE